MKLKLDDKGNVELKDDLPVYVYEDGTEGPFDAAATIGGYQKRIANLEDEKKRHFEKANEVKEKLKEFEGIDPVKSKEALRIVKNLADKQLLDEKGIEALKGEMNKSFEQRENDLKKGHQAEMAQVIEKLALMKNINTRMILKNEFASHEYFSGDRQKTVFTPDDAFRMFGANFEVQMDDKTGKHKIIAKDDSGQVILSKRNHGEPADFREAISAIVENHPNKLNWFKDGSAGGPAARGNLNREEKPPLDSLSSTGKIAEGLKQMYPQRFDN